MADAMAVVTPGAEVAVEALHTGPGLAAAAGFSEADELPERSFFPREFVGQYKRQITELVARMERLVEEVDNFEVESEAEPATEWDGVRLAALSRETVWHNLSALHDCGALLRDVTHVFQHKIRESMDMVETHPALERTVSNSSIPVSEYSSDGVDETDEDELPEGFQDVVPVKSKKEAIALNNDVTGRVQSAIGSEQEFEKFKMHALDFGTGKESAEEFYGYLHQQIGSPDLDAIVVDFARLLPLPALRIPLLKVHYTRLERERAQEHPSLAGFRNKSYSSAGRPRDSSLSSDAGYDTDEEDIDGYPSTVRLPTINHLVFVIHGIGQHIDFREGELKSWNGETGMEGGNHAFRDLFRVMLETTFRDVPLALEMQSIEWHEDLHEPTGVDNVFDLISPEGSSVIREFSKETLMDIMYYLSPRYGQLIVDTVTQQLNEKYHVFMEEHPGWNGKVSIFAHSLGSLIAYDLLTHSPGEIGHNGIRFPGLEFEVDIFFGVGSPVPVMILGRGDLNFEEGNFIPGIKMPRCRRYYNLLHPIDPIAYRVEPLMKQEMHDKDPVQLIQAHTVRGHTFGQIQEMWEALNGPVHGFAYRHDYVLKRRKREQGMMEIAFASASHSSYWMSDDVVLFTLMQLCQPVVDLLHQYMSARLPLPTLMRNIVELKPHTRVLLSATALVRDRCTGLSREQIVLIDRERLFFLPRLSEVACRRKWRVQLTPGTRAVYGEDSFTLKVVPGEKRAPSSSSGSGSFTSARAPPLPSTPQQEFYILKAPTTPIRDEWMRAINDAVVRLEEEQMRGVPSPGRLRDSSNFVEVPAGRSIDYFNAVKAGFLHEKSPKGWMEGWSNRWIVLQEDHLSCYENSPRLDFSGQFKLRGTTAFCYDKGYLIRVVSRRGTAVEMRVKNQDSFNHWLEAFEEIPSVEIVRHEELLENSPSAVLLMTGSSRGSMSGGSGKVGEWLQTKIEGHQMALDDSDLPYAAFVIHVLSSTSGATVVHRRYSEFAKLHRQLRKVIPHEKMPSLPGTRIWNKFDPTYLKDKAIGLHGYLAEVAKLCANTRAQPQLMEFLELAPPASASTDDTSSPTSPDSNGSGKPDEADPTDKKTEAKSDNGNV